MTDISIWVSLLGLFRPLISIIALIMRSATPPAGQGSPTARHHIKILKTTDISLWVSIFWLFGPLISIMALDMRSAAPPPSHEHFKITTEISLWVSILGLFGQLISKMPLGFTSAHPLAGQGSPAAPPKFKRHDRYIVMRLFGQLISITPIYLIKKR